MENTQTNPSTFTIPAFQFGDFVTRFTKLNRKAKKLGCVPATYNVLGDTVLEVKHPDAEGQDKVYKVPAKIIAVAGTAPQVGDHQFLARIEYLADQKSKLFHTIPGTDVKVDERFRDLGPGTCEHCNTIRMRRDTFVVRNIITGEQKQVGRNCLADFIGGVSPETIAARAAYFRLFDDISENVGGGGFAGYFHDRIDTDAVLRLTSAYISLYGWVPKSQGDAGFVPTSSRVWNHFSHGHFTQEERDELRRVADIAKEAVHVERAAKVIGWIKNDLAPVAKSDYELNLCTLVVGDLTETRHLGIVCSAVSAYERAMNRGIEYARRNTVKSEFVGAVDDKFANLPVSVQFVKGMSGIYGPTTLVKFVDENGNILTWFATGDKSFTPGQKLVISGTIKGHKEYQGSKETQLTRVKVA